MNDAIILRTARDRFRYTILFEITLMLVLVPIGAVFFDKPLFDIGLLLAVLSGKAMVWGLFYNWAFDKLEARSGRVSSNRSWAWRIVHAIGFEVSLTITSLPIYTLWLNIGIVEALTVDIFVTSFVVAYTFVFTLAYDRAFPLTQHKLSV